jgi:RNA polymerase sigma-70 factor (ECF subfamily)
MPTAESTNDTWLVRRFQSGEGREQAFTEIVRKHQEKLYWHIRRLVVSHEDANDVLQNTFLKAWNGLDSFREEARLYTWLYRIATNESLGFLEQKKRRSTVPMEEPGPELAEKLTSEDGYDANRIEWKLQTAIQRLPEKQRLVFCLRYYDEMPYETMSDILETSVGALKASYHHAVKKVEAWVLEG